MRALDLLQDSEPKDDDTPIVPIVPYEYPTPTQSIHLEMTDIQTSSPRNDETNVPFVQRDAKKDKARKILQGIDTGEHSQGEEITEMRDDFLGHIQGRGTNPQVRVQQTSANDDDKVKSDEKVVDVCVDSAETPVVWKQTKCLCLYWPSWAWYWWGPWTMAGIIYIISVAVQIVLLKFLWLDDFIQAYPIIILNSTQVGSNAIAGVAVGQYATGILAIGQFATGIFAVGQITRGICTFGMIGLGVFNFSLVGIGLFASIGLVSATAGFGINLLGINGFTVCSLASIGFFRIFFSLIGFQVISPFFHANASRNAVGGGGGNLVVTIMNGKIATWCNCSVTHVRTRGGRRRAGRRRGRR